MLTQEDIKNLTDYQKEVFATKDDFGKLSLEIVNIKDVMATQDDINRLETKVDNLTTSVDNYAKRANDYFQEMVMMNQKLHRYERWFHLIADKLDIKLEY